MTTETNAERLERISKTDRYMYDRRGKHVTVSSEDFDWLVQQSEKLKALESSNKRCVQVALNRQRHIDNIESENARLREALWQLNDSIDAELATEIRPIGRTTLKNRIGRALKGESE